VFTGIDIIAILLAVMVFVYATKPSKETELTFEPLTFLVVLFVAAMVVVSLR